MLNTKTGVLQISGSGSIADYSATAMSGSTAAPWRSYAEHVRSIIIKEGITKIGKNAFAGLTKLESVNFPEGLEKINESAFLHCLSLEAIELPSTVSEIGKNAFSNCGAIKTISVSPQNTVYKSDANCLIQINNDTIIRGSSSIELPADAKYIGDYAFSGCNVKSLIIPESIVYIGYGAFAECNSIEEITVPFVGDCRLFLDGTPSYTHSSDSSEENETRGKYRNTLWYLFGDNGTPKSLKKVTITDCTVIGEEAFKDSAELISVILPDCVKIIGNSAFEGCSALEKIKLPSQLEKISEKAFKDCIKISEIEIPDSVTETGSYLFDGCVKLEKVTVGKGITKIEEGSFYRCPSLSSLEVVHGNEIYYSEKHCIIEKATSKLVVGCKSSVVPDNIKIIGVGAFKNCIYLTAVVLPPQLAEIEKSAFESCTGLTELTVPENVQKIGDSAFAGCVNLKSVKIPEGVKMGDSAFKNCTSLDSGSLHIYTGNWGVVEEPNNWWIWWVVAAVGVLAIATVVYYGLILMKKKKNG